MGEMFDWFQTWLKRDCVNDAEHYLYAMRQIQYARDALMEGVNDGIKFGLQAAGKSIIAATREDKGRFWEDFNTNAAYIDADINDNKVTMSTEAKLMGLQNMVAMQMLEKTVECQCGKGNGQQESLTEYRIRQNQMEGKPTKPPTFRGYVGGRYTIKMDKMGSITLTKPGEPSHIVYLQPEADKNLVRDLLKVSENAELDKGWPVEIYMNEPRSSTFDELWENAKAKPPD